jgi:hypothetical protein
MIRFLIGAACLICIVLLSIKRSSWPPPGDGVSPWIKSFLNRG